MGRVGRRKIIPNTNINGTSPKGSALSFNAFRAIVKAVGANSDGEVV